MKRIISLILALMMTFGFVNVFAQNSSLDTKIIISNDNGAISLKLRLTGNATSNERVSVKILRPDINENDPSLNLFQKYVYIGQTRADSEGNFIFEIPFNEDYGDYSIKTINATSGSTGQTVVTSPSSQRMNEMFSKINNDEFTKETFDEFLSTYYKEVAIDLSIYSGLEEEIRFNICDKVIADDYTDFETLYKAIDANILLIGISETKKEDMIGKILSYFDKDYLNITSHLMYPFYYGYTANEKSVIHNMLINVSITQVSDINTEFAKAIFTNELKTVSNYKEMAGIITPYANYVSLDLTGYNLLLPDRQDKVLFYVSKDIKNVNDYKSFETLFANTVNNIETLILNENNSVILPPPPVIQGGGGGTGGGGGSVSIGSGAVTELPDLVDNGNEYVEKETEEFIPDYEGNDIFTDLGAVEWARESILSMNALGIINGKENKKFYPSDNTTRAEFLKMLVLSLGIKTDGGEIAFYDVSTSDWFYPYIKTGFTNGIIKGTGDNLFGPNDYITRQDAATVIYKAMTLKSYISLSQVNPSEISDYNSISDYAKNAVLMLKSYGVISGYSDGTFKPKQRITRAECAVLLSNIINLEKVIDANKEITNETDGLLGVGSMQTVNQFTKLSSKALSEATVISLDSETDYVGQIRNTNISYQGSEFGTGVLYFDFDLNSYKSQYKSVTKGLLNVVVKINDAENYYPKTLRLCAYEYDDKGTMKRYPTDQAFLGKMLSSKELFKDFNEMKAQGYYSYTFDVTEAVNNSLLSSGDILRIAFTLDSEELKGYTNEILAGKNTFTSTDFSMGIVLNTAATRMYNGTEIIYGDSQPVLNLYQ